jgi:bromodomain-containing protein 7/9
VQADFQLTLNNAKTFNPPGTMYHSEATRILTWGTDFILRAAPTVLLHHNEWSFDDPGGEVDIEGEGSASRFASVVPEDTAMDTTEADAQYAASLAGEGPGPSLRRGVRGPPPPKKSLPASKTDAGIVTGTEEFQATDGHLPGFADGRLAYLITFFFFFHVFVTGISLFPAQSEFAHLAIHLKRHGYKYKTKKERLRVEKEGAPLAADGSRDIWHCKQNITGICFAHLTFETRRRSYFSS